MNGILVIDKPKNCTSRDVVNKVGKIFNTKKEYIKIIENLILDKQTLKRLSNQARISSETYSSKYYASRVLDVYKKAIENSGRKKGLFGKIKEIKVHEE